MKSMKNNEKKINKMWKNGEIIGERIGVEIGEKIREQIGDKIGDKIGENIGEQIGEQICGQICEQIDGCHHHHVMILKILYWLASMLKIYIYILA